MGIALKKVEGVEPTAEPKALLSLEISERGISRIRVYADDIDQQTAAWGLLGRMSAQLALLQSALQAKPK